jgi:hypothetical protein
VIARLIKNLLDICLETPLICSVLLVPPVENSQESATDKIAPLLPGDYSYQEPVRIRGLDGRYLKGFSGNTVGKRKPITAILAALIHTKEGQKAALQAARKQLRVSGYAPAMATYVRETLEGKLVERVEMSGGLELSARIARARARLAEQNGSEPNGNE